MNGNNVIRILLICLASIQIAMAEEAPAEAPEEAFVTVSLPYFSSPDEVSGYVSEAPNGSHRKIQGTLLEQASAEEGKRMVWGASLPEELSTLHTVAILIKDSEGKKHFFEFQGEEFNYYPPQDADQVRDRIALLREQIEQAEKEKDVLRNGLTRLEKDAYLIGGFEAVQSLEKERDLEEGELKRIRSQVSQLKRSIDTLKHWKAPSDLTERKRVFIKDIQELQKKRGT